MTPQQAAHLYHMDSWGEPYFGVNEHGNVVVKPLAEEALEIDLDKVVHQIRAEGLDFPVLVRFQDLLQRRVVELNEAFNKAIQEWGYQNRYNGVYPIKVNQLKEVVEEILEAGEPYNFGLECGSKAELIATLPYLDKDERLLICNGYKDSGMIEMMMRFQQIGKNILPVVEKYSEFTLILQIAKKIKHRPRFGVRVKLSANGSGKWADSSGDGSKFGVSIPELVSIIEILKADGLQDGFKLVHFHLGSQISDIQSLKTATKETARVYAQLRLNEIPVELLDVGGGLGVNYDANSMESGNGINYGLEEYVNAVVYAVKEVCDDEKVPHPVLVSESGRAITAHHSVLLTEVLGATTRQEIEPHFEMDAAYDEVIKDLYEFYEMLQVDKAYKLSQLLEIYHDTVEKRREADTLFGYGYIDLKQKAIAERLYWTVCRDINDRIHAQNPEWLPPDLQELDDLLVDQYLCDFSVFQSMLDYWSIEHRFPIMPIHRLNEKPENRATLVDLTCDSDGKIHRFIAPDAEKRYLEVHHLKEGEPYMLGFFLMGAYQDILGDMHNLFGRVSEVHVYADPEEEDNYYIENIIKGETVQDMLAHVQYFAPDLQDKVRKLLQKKSKSGGLRPKIAKEVLDHYTNWFEAYPYFDPKG